MPNMRVCHMYANGSGDGRYLCRQEEGGFVVSEAAYLAGYQYPAAHIDDFCFDCEAEVVKRHPHPDLIPLQRMTL